MKNTLLTLKITLIQFLIFCSFSAFGQCNITFLTVEMTACEEDLFDVSLDFEYENTSDQFTVSINDVDYGTYNYEVLPITVTSIESDCLTEYVFVVTDAEDDDCVEDVLLPVICCDEECEIFDLVLTTSECDGQIFDLTIDFDFMWGTSSTFDWVIPGVSEGTAYLWEIPLTVQVSNNVLDILVFVVNMTGNSACLAETSFENPCIDNACNIGELAVDITDCIENEFGVIINFEYENTSDQFTVVGNGVTYGTFSYGDLPITIDGLDGNCSTEYEFVVTDVNNNDCSNFYELGTVCCGEECDLFDLVIETTNCDGTEFVVTFDFQYTGTTNNFFDWEIPGVASGFAEFTDLPLSVGIDNSSDNILNLFISENDNPDCAIDGSFENPCFDPENCFIGELDFDVSECDGNEFFVVINFEYENTSDEFFVNTNGGNYGPYLYTSLPVTIEGLEGNCDLAYEFEVYDSQNNGICTSTEYIGIVCCDEECDLFDLVIETSECDGGFFEVTFDFEYTGTTNNFFDWEIPGVTSGFAEFSDLPLTITVQNTNMNGFDLFISENDNPDCAIEGSFENPCFDGEECFISELNIEVSECDGNFFFVVINFEYENTSDQFTVNGNGISYGTFSYGDLPITIDGLESNCDLEYEFVVNDVNNNDCASDIGIGVICCEGDDCDLFDLVIETSECDGDIFTITFDFEYTGTTNNFFDWEIPGIGSGFAEFSDLPLTITVENTNANIYTLFINENDNPDCAIEGTFENPCFDGEDCFIGELNVDVSDCEGNFFFVVINFEYENTSDQFTVNGNGNSYGTFSYADLPITIDGLESNCDIEYEFVVHDVNNNDCASDIGIGVICCEGDDCDLFDLVIETSECDGDIFTITFDFEYAGTTNNFFDWEIPGIGSGFAEFSDLPLTITVENTNANIYTLFINENDNPDCAIEGTFENPCFDGEDCFIGELDVEVSECEGNFFFVVINFEYDNTSDQFTVNGNGNSYGTFSYADLPITIDGLESNCDIEYEFVVHDVNNNDCASDIDIGSVCCNGDECFIGELDVEVSECEGNFFFVVINFEYENTSDEFSVHGNGNNYGTFSYADLPVTIDGLESNCDMTFEFAVYDINDETCASDILIGTVCCEGDECFIGELDVEVSECDGNFFFVVINFEYANTSDQFTVNGNGNSYGTFSYADLPITIDGLESNCDIEYEFVVHDVNNNDCASDIDIGSVCCNGDECFIGELDVEVSECDGNFFFVVINFEYENTSDEFSVHGNGNNYGTFSYADLPVTIDGLESNCDMTFEFAVYDSNDEACASDILIGTVCCEGDDCFIGELDVEVSECEGNFFFVVINFEYENTSDEFSVHGNGNNYGTFSYADLPVTIDGLESNCDMTFEFAVYDSNDETCASDILIGTVCCEGDECFIGELDVEVSECDGNFFFVVINFEYENTSDEFSVHGNGNNYGTFSYADLPVTIDGLESNCDMTFEFAVYDSSDEACASDILIGTVCCDEDACEIVSVESAANPICEEGFIVAEWFILGENISEEGFDIFINNEFYLFVEFNESNWYDFDIENPGTENITIKVCDNDNEECCYTLEIMNPCFEGEECDLFDLNFDASECDGNFFLLEVDFEYTGTTNEFFEWEIPGVGSGFEMFANLPITIEIENTTDSQFTFFANENDNPDCDIVGSFGNPCFNSEECWIEDVSAEVILCEDDLYDVEINFEYDNVSSSFSIVGNGVTYGTFEYADLPVVLTGLSADCELEYEFVIIDDENEECSNFVEIGTICCEDFNQINGFQSETIINGDLFNISFNISNTTLKGCKIDVYVDGVLYTTLEDNESTFMIGPFDCGQDDVIEIKLINTCSDDEETLIIDLSDIECVTNVIETLEGIDLKWNMYQKTISLEGEIPVSVNLQLVNAQGSLILAENGISIGWNKTIDNLPAGLYFVRIVENNANTPKGLIRKILIY